MAYREHSYLGLNSQGFHTIVYSDWGPENDKIVIAVHGLTGNGHDFDDLAEDLIEQGYRVIAVDLPGRGRSDFLPNPMDYNYIQYYQDLAGLLAHLGITESKSIDWLGVSLGGLLGIFLASIENSPIKRLILNDVGPAVPQEALDMIYSFISQTYEFESVQALEDRMKETRGLSWGPITEEQWKHMAEHNARALPNGSITYSYDPNIAEVFKHAPIGTIDLWPCWDTLDCPTLLIQGAQSVVLPDTIVAEMQERGPGPNMDLVVFEDCGHVPSLMAPAHIDVIRKWLNESGS